MGLWAPVSSALGLRAERGPGEAPSAPRRSHMSESVDEVAFASQLFPGKTDAEAFDQFGLMRGPSATGTGS